MSYITQMEKAGAVTMEDLVSHLLCLAPAVHMLHLSVSKKGSYAAHKALQEIYEGLPEAADSVAEGYIGATKKLMTLKPVVISISSVEEAVKTLEKTKEVISKVQKTTPYTEVVNDLDAVKSLINSGIYKLSFLE